jgi:hypothetical protein
MDINHSSLIGDKRNAIVNVGKDGHVYADDMKKVMFPRNLRTPGLKYEVRNLMYLPTRGCYSAKDTSGNIRQIEESTMTIREAKDVAQKAGYKVVRVQESTNPSGDDIAKALIGGNVIKITYEDNEYDAFYVRLRKNSTQVDVYNEYYDERIIQELKDFVESIDDDEGAIYSIEPRAAFTADMLDAELVKGW